MKLCTLLIRSVCYAEYCDNCVTPQKFNSDKKRGEELHAQFLTHVICLTRVTFQSDTVHNRHLSFPHRVSFERLASCSEPLHHT
jgi:hypothetical protein